MSNIPYTLGLDIGMASVGAALLTDNEILGLHVRTFDKAETAKEGDSLNLIRRSARLTRRRIRRRAHRLLRLRRLFKRTGLIESNTVESFQLAGQNPWSLRAEGLDRVLSGPELAAALYHIVKHRGFQSNRKSEAKADEKAGEMLKGVKRNQTLMLEKGWRTIGEMVAKDDAFSEVKRNKGGDYSHTFSRADLLHETETLLQSQLRQGNALISDELQLAVTKILMDRKPTLSGETLLKMVGRCTFEKQAYRAPKASYRAERFVWLGKLNNLKISSNGETRLLTESERQIVLDLPFIKAKLTYKQLRAALDLPETARFNMVAYRQTDKDPESATFFEAKHFHEIRKAYETAGLKTEWQRDSCNPDRLDDIGYALTCFKDDNESRAWLFERGIEKEIIDAVLELSFDKFIQLSQSALMKLLPFMEEGQRYDEAATSAGYAHHQPEKPQDKKRYLPAPDKSAIINLVVYRALNQARKLVNAIIREYGPPAAINIELARDLSKPFDERKRIEKDQKAFQDEKSQAREQFKELFKQEPKALDLQKWRLYREQNAQCAYSQTGLDLNRLLEFGYVEVDHALPYSRSFDDSQNNKVLVLTAENRNKGNRTPYEYLDGASNSEGWQRFEAWVNGTKSIRQAKRNRLLRKNFGNTEAAEFRERNLNDTRYICREFKTMLETQLQWHPESQSNERCVVVSGQLTALLRARWGLIKVRDDGDLHHAMDAAVIAAANRRMVQRMAGYAKRKELEQVRSSHIDPETGEVLDIDALRKMEDHFPTPWPGFRNQLLARLAPAPLTTTKARHDMAPDEPPPVRVSRAPTRRGLGQAHQETIRSRGRNDRLLEVGQSAVKTPLSALTLKDIPRIVGFERDTRLIDAIKERLEQFGGDGKKAFAPNQPPLYKPSAPGKKAPVIRSVKLLDTQKSGIPIRNGIANNGNMLRVDIFTKGGKFFAVPVYVADAAKPSLPNRAIFQAKPESEWPLMDEDYQFLFSLYPNDWLRIELKDGVYEGYFAGIDRSNAAVSLWTHDRNQHIGKDGLYRGIGIKVAKSLSKYHVDMLGRLHKVHHEERRPLNTSKGK